MFPTLIADPFFIDLVYFHVSLETVLGFKDLAATEYITPKSFITLLIYLSHF